MLARKVLGRSASGILIPDPTTAAPDASYIGLGGIYVGNSYYGPTGMDVLNGGQDIYCAGYQASSAAGIVTWHHLSDPNDLTTAVLMSTRSVHSNERLPTGCAVSSNGKYIYVTGTWNGNRVWQYQMGDGGDMAASFTYLTSKSLPASPSDVYMSPDGTKMLISSGATIYEFSLSIPGMIASATQVGSFTFSDTTYNGANNFHLISNGTRLYRAPQSTTSAAKVAYEYELSTPYSVVNGSVVNTGNIIDLTPPATTSTSQGYFISDISLAEVKGGIELLTLEFRANRIGRLVMDAI